jgi:hypothetical protein
VVKSVRVGDISELSLVPSISMCYNLLTSLPQAFCEHILLTSCEIFTRVSENIASPLWDQTLKLWILYKQNLAKFVNWRPSLIYT